MAILYKPTNEPRGIYTQPTNDPIDDMSKRKPYVKSATKAAPYLSTWLQDPITVDKMKTQFSTKDYDIAGKMLSNIGKYRLFDMRKLGSFEPKKFKSFVADINTRPGAYNPNTQSYNTDLRYLSKMRQYGQAYDPITHRGVQGVRMPGFKTGIGSIYPVSNPDVAGTITHELTHGTGYQNRAEKYLYENWGSKQIPYESLKGLGFDESEKQLNYLRSIGKNVKGEYGEGAYPRIMQLRKMLNLVPGQEVNKEMFQDIDFKDEHSPLRGLRANWDDDTIVDILNTIAYNKQNIQPDTMMA